jgi:hypothetical protein
VTLLLQNNYSYDHRGRRNVRGSVCCRHPLCLARISYTVAKPCLQHYLTYPNITQHPCFSNLKIRENLKSTILWDITPCSPLEVNRRFGRIYKLHLEGRRISRTRNQRAPNASTLISCSDYFSILKMGAICSSETLVDFQRITRRYIPEDSTLHNHYCENLKCYREKCCFDATG